MNRPLVKHLIIVLTLIGSVSISAKTTQGTDMQEQFSQYILDEPSGLSHRLPTSEFKGFSRDEIESGRLYFWIKQNPSNILQSDIIFFVLQDRYGLTYTIVDDIKLADFNDQYRITEITENDNDREGYESLYGDLYWMQKKIDEQNYQAISQEAIIQILTTRDSSDIIAQTPLFSIYLTYMIFDIYEGMIQTWSAYEDDSSYTTTFFPDKASQAAHLDKLIKTELEEGMEAVTKREVRLTLKRIPKIGHDNRTHKQRVHQYQSLLTKSPKLQSMLSLDMLHQLQIDTELTIIDGDHSIKGDMIFCKSERRSLLITGDLKVSGALLFPAGCRDQILIVGGNVEAEHFIYSYQSFSNNPVFANNLNIVGVTYLAAGSRYWGINIGGMLKTETLIHNKILLEDSMILYEKAYQLQDLDEGLFNGRGYLDESQLYRALTQKINILKEPLSKQEFSQSELADAFSSYISQWHTIFYKFSGFENLHYSKGTYAGSCYVGSGDEVLMDTRTQSGRYCMDHDTFELLPLDTLEPKSEITPASVKLAYRFYWIMWTFSDWEHRDDGPLDYWQDRKQISQTFDSEKSYINEDPHLALYWILHFGLLDDPQYNIVKKIMENSNHGLIKGAIAWIDSYQVAGGFPKKFRESVNIELVTKRIEKHIFDLKKSDGY